MKEWLVQLKGHRFDLEELTTKFHTPDVSIIKKDNEYYLKSEEFDSLTKPSDVLSAASKIIELVNGAVKIFAGRFQNVHVSGSICEISKCGERKHYIHLAGTIHVRTRVSATVIVSNGVIKSPKRPNNAELLVEAATADATIADALHFISIGENWNDLYKVFEIIRDDLSDVKTLVTDKELSRFRGTAQSRSLLGDSARHASKKFIGPGRLPPMTLSEAKSFIYTLFQRWLDKKGLI